MKYSFGPESLISRVEIVRTETGAKRAYLESALNADKAKLAEVREALAKHGYLTVPIEVGGKPLLEVRKFSSQESLLKQLGEAGGTSGMPAQQMAVQDRVGAWQWIKNNTFKACLSLYAIGDISYIFYGREKEKFGSKKGALENEQRKLFNIAPHPDEKDNPFDKYAGWAYLAGTASSVVSTAMRGDQSDEEVYAISEKIRDKLNTEGGTARSTTYKAIEDDKKTGAFERIKTAFIKHPAEVLNLCYAAAGLFISIAAKQHLTGFKERLNGAQQSLNIAKLSGDAHAILACEEDVNSAMRSIKIAKHDIGLGAITLTSGVLSSVVKEKPKTADEPEPKGIFAKAWRWLEEKPLRIAGGGYLISTLIHIHSTTADYKRIAKDRESADSFARSSNVEVKQLAAEKLALAKKEVGITHGRMIFCVTNVIAEILMMLSSKGHGEGVKSDATVETSATAIAAENIALQAPEKREELVEKFAEHLASPKVMGGSSVMIARGIRANLKSLDSNPWADTAKGAHTERVTNHATNDAQHAIPAVG